MVGRTLEEVQPGWKVVAGDGRELGTVVGIGNGAMRVKKRGLLGGELTVPADAVSSVDEGRVYLTLTKQVLEKL
jgi:hypothetical protein